MLEILVGFIGERLRDLAPKIDYSDTDENKGKLTRLTRKEIGMERMEVLING